MISVSIDHNWDGVCSKYSWTTAAADKQTYRMVYRDRSALPLVARFTMFANPARTERISVLLQIWSEQKMATGCPLKSVGACGTYDSAPARLLRPGAIYMALVVLHGSPFAPTSNPTLSMHPHQIPRFNVPLFVPSRTNAMLRAVDVPPVVISVRDQTGAHHAGPEVVAGPCIVMAPER